MNNQVSWISGIVAATLFLGAGEARGATGRMTAPFGTARAAALHTAAGQLDRVMATLSKPATLLRNRMGNPPVATTRLSDSRISSRSPSGRAERHQVVTRMKAGPGSRHPLADIRVSVTRLSDGSFKGYVDGSLRRVRVRFSSQGAWVAADPNAPALLAKVKKAIKPANKLKKAARPKPARTSVQPATQPTTSGKWSKKVYSSSRTAALSIAASRMTPAIGAWWSGGVHSSELQIERTVSKTSTVTRYLVATQLRNTRPMMRVYIDVLKAGGQYRARAVGGVDVADALSGGEGTGPVGDEH